MESAALQMRMKINKNVRVMNRKTIEMLLSFDHILFAGVVGAAYAVQKSYLPYWSIQQIMMRTIQAFTLHLHAFGSSVSM